MKCKLVDSGVLELLGVWPLLHLILCEFGDMSMPRLIHEVARVICIEARWPTERRGDLGVEEVLDVGHAVLLVGLCPQESCEVVIS